jgi:hypothetical protein
MLDGHVPQCMFDAAKPSMALGFQDVQIFGAAPSNAAYAQAFHRAATASSPASRRTQPTCRPDATTPWPRRADREELEGREREPNKIRFRQLPSIRPDCLAGCVRCYIFEMIRSGKELTMRLRNHLTKRHFALAGLLIALSFDSAVAQQPGGALRQACTSDFTAYCAGVQTGGGRAIACLRQHAATLSPACRQALATVGGGQAAPAGAPAAPPPTAMVAPPPAAAMAAPPPPPPPAAMASPPPGAVAVLPPPVVYGPPPAAVVARACDRDRRKFCDVSPSAGNYLSCLVQAIGVVSKRCQAALTLLMQSQR